jgi:hypothetical protein
MSRSALFIADSYPRSVSVQGNGRVLPVSQRQLPVPMSHNTINRAFNPGRVSQLYDFTCINGKYKALL